MPGFNDFVGQEQLVIFLKKRLQEEKLHQALLFVGPAGSGKKTLALFLGAALNCADRKEPPCGQCLSCRKTTTLTQPDLRIISREGSNIRIEQIRRLKEETVSRPYEGRKRVWIIDGAEDMSVPAANSFLKLLEEPPEYVNFILLTSRAQALLPTIKSRCQIFTFKAVAEEKLAEFLVERENCSLNKARTFASLAGGVVGQAVAMVTDENFQALRSQVASFFSRLQENEKGETFPLAEELSKEKNLKLFLSLWLLFLRDVLIYRQLGRQKVLYNIDFLASLEQVNSSETGLLKAIEIVLMAQKKMITPINLKLMLGVFLLELKEVL